MRIAVTGGAGLTGGEIVRLLVAQRHEVRVLVRNETQRSQLPDGVSIVVGDCRDESAVRALLAGVDGLVHCAGILLASTMTAGVQAAELQRLVAVSTASASLIDHPHGLAYRGAEEELRRACPRASFLRPTMIYGSERDRNVHHLIAFARRFRVLPLPGAGTARIQPIHYDDAAAATMALLQVPRTTIEAGGEQALTLREAALAIFQALGLRGRVVPISLELARPVARLADGVTGSRWTERLERSRIDRVADNAAASTLGLRPRRFELGVAQQVARMTHA